MDIPRLNGSQHAILDLLKHRGTQTIPRLADALDLNVETVRSHVKGLERETLVRREGTIGEGRGRPEIVYGLTAEAERLFPRREPEILRGLAEFLRRTDHEDLLDDFLDEWLGGERRSEALARVAGLQGRERLAEVAAILTEFGFMAVVEEEAGGPRLRLCHCPIRSLVDATRRPCRIEIGFVHELLGEPLEREAYIPAGDDSCTYRVES